jgi:hypothetical protein
MEHLVGITPEIAKAGLLHLDNGDSVDLLTHICYHCDTENDALIVAKRLVELGYVRIGSDNTKYSEMIDRKRWRLLWFCEKRQWFGRFFPGAWIMHELDTCNEYRAFCARESIARDVSIALIGVGKQRKREPGALDAMRVIARVVYSDWQLEEEGWEPPINAAKRRRL